MPLSISVENYLKTAKLLFTTIFTGKIYCPENLLIFFFKLITQHNFKLLLSFTPELSSFISMMLFVLSCSRIKQTAGFKPRCSYIQPVTSKGIWTNLTLFSGYRVKRTVFIDTALD